MSDKPLSSSPTPCPGCDTDRAQLSPLAALAFGVALGAAFDDMHKVTEIMCSKHRARYIILMAQAAIMANTEEPDYEAEDLEEPMDLEERLARLGVT